MREQLEKYVELLFAGNPGSEDIKQEILQNTLDKFDDYIAQGKPEEAAYRLAISGIGDISEILGNSVDAAPSPAPSAAVDTDYRGRPITPMWKKVLRAIAVCMFIISVIPVIVLSETGLENIGVVAMLTIVAVAVAMLIISGGNETAQKAEKKDEDNSPNGKLKNAIGNVITVAGLIVYFAISFESGAWHITWLVFPIMAAVRGLCDAIIDLKGGANE